jgi:hypothetical protein
MLNSIYGTSVTLNLRFISFVHFGSVPGLKSSLWALAYCVQISDLSLLPVLPIEISVASPPSCNSSSTRDHHSITFEVLKFCS